MPSDPWKAISVPTGALASARLADANHPFDFYWARNHEGRCLLVFEYPESISIRDRRPKLGEIQIVESRPGNEAARFILELSRDENREIFHRLCLDIIESTRGCVDERSALATMIRRTWRWHGMLKGGRDERLGSEAQKGLIGELRVLEMALLPKVGAADAVEFWRGPQGAPKDFSIGNIAIESKAKRGASKPFVKISSEHQLDRDALDALFLAITYVDEGARELTGSQTITEYVSSVARSVEEDDSGALGHLESRLDEVGYLNEHDYSDRYWLVGQTRWYRLTEGFPCIVHSALPSAVRNVEYALDIADFDPWEAKLKDFHALLGDKSE